jgi:hypothetical protein
LIDESSATDDLPMEFDRAMRRIIATPKATVLNREKVENRRKT